MLGSIIVPLDGSVRAESVLPLAMSLATQDRRSILLLRVLPHPSAEVLVGADQVITIDEQLAALESHAATYLQEQVGRITRSGLSAQYAMPTGPAAETIAAWAHEQKAPWVVMATHGHGGLTRWTLGSVADRLLRACDRPLLIQRPQAESDTAPDELPQIRNILVPLDGSDLAEEILPHAVTVAKLYGATLLLLRAVPSVAPVALGIEGIGVDARWFEGMRDEAHHYLEEVATPLRAQGLTIKTLVGTMPAADTILESSTQYEVDLVAMTSHARAPLGRAILGSVTDRIIRAGATPVLVTRAGVVA